VGAAPRDASLSAGGRQRSSPVTVAVVQPAGGQTGHVAIAEPAPAVLPGQDQHSPARARDLRSAAAILAGSIVLGVPAGLIWAATAPRIDVPAALDGAESAFEAQAGADIAYGAVAIVAGALCGALAWWLAYRRGALVPVALAAGGAGGALVAAAVGHQRNSGRVLAHVPPDLSQRAHDVVDFGLRTHQAIALWPVAALLMYIVLTVGLTEPEPRPQRLASPGAEPPPGAAGHPPVAGHLPGAEPLPGAPVSSG
jgi:hypothetical protein